MVNLDRFRFRAWNKISKCMFTGLPYSGCGKDTFDAVLKYPQVYEVMQCAAVYDNGEVLIYEGDYLTDGEILWEVRYNETHCGFYAIAVAGVCVDSAVFSLWHLCNRHNAGRSVYVVGNIYEYKGPLSKLIK